MAKKTYEGELFKGIDFAGNEETGGLPLSGQRVQEYLKGADFGLDSKVGDIYYDENTKRFLCFADAETRLLYIENPQRTDLIITSFVASTEGAATDIYSMTITVNTPTELTITSADLKIPVKAASVVKYGSTGEIEEISETAVIEIQTRTSTSSAWITRGSRGIPTNLTSYTDVDISEFLASGQNYIRVRAMGEYATSIWKSFSVYVVSLALIPNTNFEVPLTGEQLKLNYKISGAIAKTLQFEIGTGLGSSFVAQYSYLKNDPDCSVSLGTQTNTSTGITFAFTNADMSEVIMSPGIHTVKARLYVSDTVLTDWVESQYMVASDTQPYVIINNVAKTVNNWSDVTFFNWAVSTMGQEELEIVFKLLDSATDEVLASWTQIGKPNMMYSLSTQLGIEIEDQTVTEFYAYMKAYDTEGNEISNPVFYAIGNSASFAPTAGADLIISPSSRTNNEISPKTIINSVDGSIVESTWEGFGMISDGWLEVPSNVDDSGSAKIRALNIPAGRKLTVKYNPFSDFMGQDTTGKHVTIEIDFRTNNILDETEPIIQMCTTYNNDGKAWGLEILPLEAYLMTVHKRKIDDQNLTWAEGIRQHLTINIVYGLNGRNLVRFFLGGDIEREFVYEANDVFVGGPVDMVFGNTKSDLDIFGIRVYKKALSTAEVMQDRKAAFSTVDEKIKFYDDNDILGDDDCIDYNKTAAKYNVIGLTGHLAKYGDDNKGKTKGNKLTIHMPGDLEHSGTLTELENSGQGTTAMTYYDWNQQQKTSGESMFIPELDPSNPVSASGGFSPFPGEMAAKKLCGKINFASSMQGHKMGATLMFTELFKHLVNTGAITKPGQFEFFPAARISVYQEPFFFFHRETESDPWVFKYLMTWGAAKGDKPTFGFDKKKTPHMLMLEGANNDRTLALFRTPWNDNVTYDPSEEAFMFNGESHLDFGFGLTSLNEDGDEYPSDTDAINAFKNFFNFVYRHNKNMLYYSGTLTQLRADDVPDKSKFYWTTNDDAALGSHRYDVFRYDTLSKTWVNAGEGLVDGEPDVMNIRTQYEEFCNELGSSPLSWTAGEWEIINNLVISTRISHFKAFASNHIHVDDALYHICIIKLIAGTDNRAKNTYYYTDPLTLKIRHMQDDLDTIIKTNNVGQNRKPYYVEEHDTNASGEFYWQGESSGYYGLLETAFENEMTSMMYNILNAMASISGSPLNYLSSRMLKAQNYYPVIAYNEQARLVYEQADIAQKNGTYVNTSVEAISQSVGSQKWSEYDWLKNRVMYISSWCEYGEFAGSSSAANGLSWRGKAGAKYNFKLTPAKWLYPRVGSDSGNYPAGTGDAKRVRIKAGETISYPEIILSSDSWISIRGINYYVDIGDMNIGLSSDQGTFSFYGKLLQQINVNPEGSDTNLMLATQITIANATNIKSFVVRGVSTITSSISLSKCTRLETIDLRGSSFNIVELPASDKLSTIMFPATLNSIRIDAQPNLETVDIEGVEYLSSVYIDQSKAGSFDSAELAYNIFKSKTESGGSISSAKFYNVNWSAIKADMLMYYNSSDVSTITGKISMSPAASDRFITFYEIRALVDKYGNIQSESNPLYIEYPKRTITSFSIKGEKYIKTVGPYDEWEIMIAPTTGNNVLIDPATQKESVKWEFTGDNASRAKNYAIITDDIRGAINVIKLQEDEDVYTIRITINLIDGSSLTFDKGVGFFNRIPKVNDFAYVDGSFDNEYDKSKSLAGAVLRREQVDSSTYKLIVCAHQNTNVKSSDGALNLTSFPWGLYSDSAGTNGFPTDMLTEIATMSGIASATDTDMPNIMTSGLRNADGTSTDYYYIDDLFLDNARDDGYAQIVEGGAYCVDNVLNNFSSLYDGYAKTDYIIKHANSIITNYLQEKYPSSEKIKIPTTMTELGDALQEIVNLNSDATNKNRYYQFFYPAAYSCRLYEPPVNSENGESLNEQYKKGKWFLPAQGDLTRMYNFYHNSCGRNTSTRTVSATYANENPENEALLPLFSNLLARVQKVQGASNAFIMPTAAVHWSSSEYFANGSWYVYFQSGTAYYTGKCNSLSCRPFSAFIFKI